ncbi:aminoglycoside phosphotransferase family protein [Saccharibacillus sp. JS10]|uniref:aminoglycoside phosphotransferase family protein n=1 Tax=Saccharibacillus sp. JS10 TaxID=2950552 RepID=UPI00210C7531|nr:aminoglycoside phosphotransferase family protein [Saccharibacillus sp. JS10]MCQ4088430.1 aminoglycoside phosphotransferase family protein [Saccharibacillus sp. JS10]
MPNTDAKSKVLRTYNINETDLIGSGMEAEVYRYGENKVLKIYNGTSNYEKQERLKHLYDSIQSSDVSFEFPYIYDIADEDNLVVTIEKRIAGENMQNVLSRLNDKQIDSMMKTYLSASLEMQAVKLNPKFEGYKLFDDYRIPASHQKDWHDLLKQYVMKKQNEVNRYFSKDVVHYEEKLKIILANLSSEYQGNYSLIHGDFYPGNLLVNQEGKITGLIDFGLMTMYGDYLFDIATGWVFFDMYDELKANILERYLDVMISTLGEEVRGKLYFYVLIFSLISANFYSEDCSDGHYQWCVKNLNNEMYWNFKDHFLNSSF